jgi:TonB-dependent receptor
MGVTASDTYRLGNANEDNFGVAFTLSYFDRALANDNTETGGGWSQDDNGVLEGTSDLEQRDYLVTRERIGAGLNLDYKVGERSSVYFRSLYSQFADEEVRNATIFEWDDPQLQGAEAGAASGAKEAKFREETQVIASFNLGGETVTDSWTFEYSAAYSFATEEQDLSSDSGPLFEFDGDLTVGLVGSDVLTVLPSEGFDDPANFELDAVELVFVDSEDEITAFRFDASKEIFLFGADSELAFGAKVNLRTKTVNEDVFESDGGDLDSNLAAWADRSVDYSLDPSLAFGVNGSAYADAILRQRDSIELVEGDSVFADSSIDENIYAAYVQLTQDFGDLRLVYGLRAEMTDLKANGFEFFEDEETGDTSVTSTAYSRDYSNFFPSINARWNVSDELILRGAITTSMSRPTFEQITPSVVRTDNPGDDEFSVETGNSELDALESINIDLMAEYYPSENAVLSAGIFYKDISNFIYEGTVDGESIGFAGYEVDTFLNADDAYIAGVEFNAIYTWSSGFLLSANMTFVDAETTIDFEDGSRDIQLPNQAESVGNVTIGFERDRYSLRFSAAYRSQAFIEAGSLDDPFEDVYEDDNLMLQFSGYFNATNNLQFFAKIQNLTDEPYYAYQARRELNFQYETYDVAYYLGFEWNNR